MPVPAPVPTPVPVPVPPPTLAVPTVPPSGAATPGRVVWQPDGAIQVILPAGYVPPELAANREIEPQVKSLQTSLRPTERMTAVESLAGGRYGTSDGVKMLLFRSAQADPCPMVKVCCIEQLTKLGYREPAFMDHLKTAAEGRNEEVRDAAKAALQKLAPQK